MTIRQIGGERGPGFQQWILKNSVILFANLANLANLAWTCKVELFGVQSDGEAVGMRLEHGAWGARELALVIKKPGFGDGDARSP